MGILSQISIKSANKILEIISRKSGKSEYQPLFEKMLETSLSGMDLGVDPNSENKQELAILEYVNRKGTGKVKYQRFYESLLGIALRGMNIGVGSNVDNSGEIPALKYIGEKLKSNREHLIVFDVGANAGKYSQLVSDSLQQFKKEIFAFEPSPKTFAKLQLNLKNNKEAKPYNIGFSDKKEKVKLYLDQETSEMASLYKRRLDHFNLKMEVEEEVKLETIDNFCVENNIKNIDLLKLDVEGNELKTLDGANKMLADRSIKFIQIEFGGCNIDSRTFFQDFYYKLKDNYKIYRIVNNGLFRIRQYKETYELFTTTNFLAELGEKK